MEEYEVITIPVSDGTEKEFAIIDKFEVEEEEYVAVSLIVDDQVQDGVYIYRYAETEEGEAVVETISLPSEYKKVIKAYEKMV